MVQAPIFHVNGDDPEAAVRVMKLAFEFRNRFKKDVVVDLVCYRRYGHNEADEPAFTQPRMYELIDDHLPVRALYTQQLVQRGDITADDEQAVEYDFKARLDRAFEETQAGRVDKSDDADRLDGRVSDGDEERPTADDPVATAVPAATLAQVVEGFTRWPEGFAVNPKLERQLVARGATVERNAIDWATAEALAFGSLVIEGTPVRLAGQDTRRGTFSQRHGVIVDQANETEYVPLAHLSDDQAPFMLYDTVLSEYAALGFEYGYSISSDALVCWEAQFGDFANVAQVVIDQFVSTAADKWGQRSSLALLLPHGLEGQGPEHSSARIERYLTLSAEGNLHLVYPTTAAQYFHVLRRQALSARQVPLVCFTPKRYLRMPSTRSPLSAFTEGAFSPVLDDRGAPDVVNRVILCTGKIGHELMDERDARGAPAAIVRVEELYPWPEAKLFSLLDRYPDAKQVWWVQEEPANMGAWNYIHIRLHKVLRNRAKLKHVSRAPSASPASGSSKVHDAEQQRLLAAAFAKL
jgi:2-oxoglutarate dehydrogenase E1 component/2-oxoglutarate decarboxylase